MSSYPIKYHHLRAVHSGGTKEYNFHQFDTADGKSVVVFSWGKIDTFGQAEAFVFESLEAAAGKMNSKINSKIGGRGGYSIKGDQTISFENKIDLLSDIRLKMLLNAMGANALRHLDSTIQTSSAAKETPDQQRDENGNWVLGKNPRKVDLSEQIAAEKAAREAKEKAEADTFYANNPLYGRF